jgi:hypothetical protein
MWRDDVERDGGRILTCMKVGLLPANMHKRVNTKAARPKMTGINAVGRSILKDV